VIPNATFFDIKDEKQALDFLLSFGNAYIFEAPNITMVEVGVVGSPKMRGTQRAAKTIENTD